MSDNTITHLCKKIQDGPARFVVNWEYDYVSDASDLGTYTDKPGEWQIDRINGLLLGEYTENETEWGDEQTIQTKADELEEDGMEVCWNYQDQEDGSTVHALYYWGYEILARDLRKTYERHAYKYFVPANSHKEDEITQDERVKYILQDYERAADYGNEWYYTGCIVTMYIDGTEVAAASLWGIESDSGDDYIQEVEQELIDQCKNDARSKAAALRDAANKLDEYLNPDLLCVCGCPRSLHNADDGSCMGLADSFDNCTCDKFTPA
jgi:hypothetical protein